jgi:hypothetical protein
MTGIKWKCCLCGQKLAMRYARYDNLAMCKSCTTRFTFDKSGNVISRANRQIHKTHEALETEALEGEEG